VDEGRGGLADEAVRQELQRVRRSSGGPGRHRDPVGRGQAALQRLRRRVPLAWRGLAEGACAPDLGPIL
jgi:hypothetical protein